MVFGPHTSINITAACASAYSTNGGHKPANHGQFSPRRFAFLFEPGTYDVECPVGYYTQVLGLGTTPSDVTFTSARGVYAEEQDYSLGGALQTFWRGAENFKSEASFDWRVGKGMLWAVSQAAPLRRIEVANDLMLYEYQPPIPFAGQASGGFMANVKVGAAIRGQRTARALAGAQEPGQTVVGGAVPGSQQQWFARDSTVASWDGGVWNMVFCGVEGAPPSHCGIVPGTAIAPLILQAAFLPLMQQLTHLSRAAHMPSCAGRWKQWEWSVHNDRADAHGC